MYFVNKRKSQIQYINIQVKINTQKYHISAHQDNKVIIHTNILEKIITNSNSFINLKNLLILLN